MDPIPQKIKNGIALIQSSPKMPSVCALEIQLPHGELSYYSTSGNLGGKQALCPSHILRSQATPTKCMAGQFLMRWSPAYKLLHSFFTHPAPMGTQQISWFQFHQQSDH